MDGVCVCVCINLVSFLKCELATVLTSKVIQSCEHIAIYYTISPISPTIIMIIILERDNVEILQDNFIDPVLNCEVSDYCVTCPDKVSDYISMYIPVFAPSRRQVRVPYLLSRSPLSTNHHSFYS